MIILQKLSKIEPNRFLATIEISGQVVECVIEVDNTNGIEGMDIRCDDSTFESLIGSNGSKDFARTFWTFVSGKPVTFPHHCASD